MAGAGGRRGRRRSFAGRSQPGDSAAVRRRLWRGRLLRRWHCSRRGTMPAACRSAGRAWRLGRGRDRRAGIFRRPARCWRAWPRKAGRIHAAGRWSRCGAMRSRQSCRRCWRDETSHAGRRGAGAARDRRSPRGDGRRIAWAAVAGGRVLRRFGTRDELGAWRDARAALRVATEPLHIGARAADERCQHRGVASPLRKRRHRGLHRRQFFAGHSLIFGWRAGALRHHQAAAE